MVLKALDINNTVSISIIVHDKEPSVIHIRRSLLRRFYAIVKVKINAKIQRHFGKNDSK